VVPAGGLSPVSTSLAISLVSLGIWIYLFGFRGMFWLFRERDGREEPAFMAKVWPSVTAIVPARDEADVIERSVGSLAGQDYPGDFRIIVVDDQSNDETAERVRKFAGERLVLVEGAARPPGWTGKLWALSQGIARADQIGSPDYIWFTDADIVHAKDNLRQLVARAQSGDLTLASLMAKLRCESLAERFLIPAFVFFFAMLFPFSWVNSRERAPAAGAGGCMLIKRDALERAGGLESVRHEIIDDCALAGRLKAQGPIWIGLTERAISIRAYETLRAIRSMVARSAYAQLNYSPALLGLTMFAMALSYGAPPLLVVFGTGYARLAAAFAWIGMIVAFQPMLRFYGRNPAWGAALPVIAAFYAAFTLDSAIQFGCGRGGMWKGRVQAITPMRSVADLSSGKGSRDENFPVAFLVRRRHRGIILAFYLFVRAADDIADHPNASADEKLRLLEKMRRSLIGESDTAPVGVALRGQLAARGLSTQHALDLLEAFRRDVTKLRYRDWDDLMDYCSVSAMPVGRFVLDVHGESRAIWPTSDALCAALQVINHLQDCGADYRNLDRVYIPLDVFAAEGITPTALGESQASPHLRAVIAGLARRTLDLLVHAEPFSAQIQDRRLAMEVSVIHALAKDLGRRLLQCDPLSDRVHHRRSEVLMLAIPAAARRFAGSFGNRAKRPEIAGERM